MGTQGFREIGGLLADPEIRIVAVCDPNTKSNDYVEWGRNDIRNTIRALRRESLVGRGPQRLSRRPGGGPRGGGRLLRQPKGGASSQVLLASTPTSASCWTKRRTSTPSRS